MLIGEFASPLGDKNRVALPKKLRDELQTELIITRGYEACLLVVDYQRWQALTAEINKHPLLNLSVRDTKRFLLGGAFELTLDAQGRFVIPEGLITYAGIDKEVVFIGVGEWIEIWDMQRWQAKLKDLSQNSADIADRLSSIN
jgi:MraZ protein